MASISHLGSQSTNGRYPHTSANVQYMITEEIAEGKKARAGTVRAKDMSMTI